jgi:hypothetical protein
MTGDAEAMELAPAAAAPLPVMSPRTRTGLCVLAAAVTLGVAGDLLLRPMPWGLNLALWTLELCGATVAVERWSGTERAAAGWIPGAIAVSLLMAWRDSPTLKALDVFALLAVLCLAAFHAQGGPVVLAGVGDYLLSLVAGAGYAIAGAVPVLGYDVMWGEIPRGGWSGRAAAVVRGLLFAAPLLLIFGALLAAADAAFEGLLTGLPGIRMDVVIGHVVMAGVFAWLSSGFLRALFVSGSAVAKAKAAPALGFRIGVVEAGIVLGALNALFLAFVVVQARWFFGGTGVVASQPGLGYAEYARRGFFELVTVATLVLPLLLGVHWLLRGDGRGERAFRWLAGVQLGLLSAIMASAMWRMWMYQAAYGLTELRLYTTAFMLWLAVVFVWFAATVLRGRRDRFVFGALVAGAVTLGALHLASPDAVIVAVNANRPDAEQRFDAAYASSLSGDAVPGVLRALPRLNADERCMAAKSLLKQWAPSVETDWRAWSWGSWRARSAVARREPELRAACTPEIEQRLRDRQQVERERRTAPIPPPRSGPADGGAAVAE